MGRPKDINSAPTYVRVRFNQQTPTFDLTLERPMEKLQFGQIRLPYGLHMVLPLKGDLLLSAKSAANLISATTWLLPIAQSMENSPFKPAKYPPAAKKTS